MKFFEKLYIGIFLSTLTLSNVYAADVEAGIVKTELQIPESYIGSDSLDLSKLAVQDSASSSKSKTSLDDDDVVTPAAAASGITYYEIYAVGSTLYGGWQYPTASQTSTINDHGGTELKVVVLQYGYGNPNNATLNGLSRSAYATQNLCGPLNSLHVCTAGETLTGFLRYYDFSGQQAGQFTSSANSTASPFGYWSDSIYIQ